MERAAVERRMEITADRPVCEVLYIRTSAADAARQDLFLDDFLCILKI